MQGELGDLYKDICSIESKQQRVNPESKAPYKSAAASIQDALCRFNNGLQAVKIYFQKSAAKSRAKKKAKAKEEDE